MELGEILKIAGVSDIRGRYARFLSDHENEARVAEAVSLCMGELRCLAPELGGDNGAVFESMLRARISGMLKGGYFFEHGHGRVCLPALVEDLSFFGDPWMGGSRFLVVIKVPMLHGGQELALEPGARGFKPLEEVSEAWGSFAEAAAHAKGVVARARATVDQLREIEMRVRAVATRSTTGGFELGD